ncbi:MULTISPECIES: hypothetical protein [Bizionia]|uniref:DUF2933 domain-containing protein n=1 Tax=Bizionia algoritergicola TaxID=291187 RepID=A0A5D0QWV9_9FLAO|nr:MULTISPECIES: hypothetical protein [Bizionia]OBX23356.1 hypothetical protein BAA08_04690 [Bizionia sp. APA-3]TYB73349.1 hypothetical protein ES675_06720 [Bizionia algoritergicola]UPS91282.1 hypothetical protein GMA17_05905 [Bizionia sp. M204]
MKNNHWIWMVIGCGLPLLFIFLAPSFGIGGGSSLFIFILFMFGIHLFMPHGSHRHGGHNHSQHKQNDEIKNGQNTPSAKPKDQQEGHNH